MNTPERIFLGWDRPMPAVDISGRTRRQKLVNMKNYPQPCMGYSQRSYRVHFGL